MTREQRLRRIGRLCLYCLRHIAYYRAGWKDGSLLPDSIFWVAVNGNFIDICVLEWCKLFGDSKSKYFWEKGIADPDAFFSNLLRTLQINKKDFDDYVIEMRIYRDKYVAHWDSGQTIRVPSLDIAKASAVDLYNYLIKQEDQNGYFDDGPEDASNFYVDVLQEGTVVYQTLRNSGTFPLP